MKTSRKKLIVLIALMLTFAACAVFILVWVGKTPLSHGVNLGNMLESPKEGDWGEIFSDTYPPIIKSAGFDHVRLPVAWATHALTEEPYTVPDTYMQRVDHVVNACLQSGLSVILDFHGYSALSDAPDQEGARFLAIWKQLSDHFANASPKLLFELASEPYMDKEHWNSLIARVMPIIRAKNPKRLVLVGGTGWNGAADLYNLILPDDPYLIGTFHLYTPFQFTHQGADWTPNAFDWLGTKWAPTTYEQSEILVNMALAKGWSEMTGYPIHLGEFGALSTADMASRTAWTDFVVKQAEKRGFSWSYWEFCAGFGVYDNETELYYPELLKALLPSSKAR